MKRVISGEPERKGNPMAGVALQVVFPRWFLGLEPDLALRFEGSLKRGRAT